jgi:uncharacterized protein DUF2840
MTTDPAEDSTSVELMWVEKEIEYWIRFGRVIHERILDRRRRVVSFAPGRIFATVRWMVNDYGTILSRIDIVRAARPGEPYSTVFRVQPGGESLLRCSGWPRVERVLKVIDAIEVLGIAPEDAAPDHWRHVHARLLANEPPRAYTLGRHRAWLKRWQVTS